MIWPTAPAAGDAGGGRSVRGDSATPIPAAVLDSARGAEFHGFVEKSGKPLGLEPTTGTSAAAQIQGLLSDFFPWIRAGVKVATAGPTRRPGEWRGSR